MSDQSTKVIVLASLWTLICLIGTLLWACLRRRHTHTQSFAADNAPIGCTGRAQVRSSRIVTIAVDNILIKEDEGGGGLVLIRDSIEPLKKFAAEHQTVLIAQVRWGVGGCGEYAIAGII
eukprot:Blabericola_migrator_1__8327@NODE_4329_length_1218_cov_103_818419_g566_i1_p4_GENE_NODE_4329_length_1218_cov_103_818419_g566_i1NODE_4329_length_1218_cov_103_818419_g566_i1_p4_ORF_typecomplete_len120_score12_67Herpes_gE/PF02480_16/0_063TMEM52/PF14979_6/0_17_NODE_4329_length_1218_cov_103_818419_g566_i155414